MPIGQFKMVVLAVLIALITGSFFGALWASTIACKAEGQLLRSLNIHRPPFHNSFAVAKWSMEHPIYSFLLYLWMAVAGVGLAFIPACLSVLWHLHV